MLESVPTACRERAREQCGGNCWRHLSGRGELFMRSCIVHMSGDSTLRHIFYVLTVSGKATSYCKRIHKKCDTLKESKYYVCCMYI